MLRVSLVLALALSASLGCSKSAPSESAALGEKPQVLEPAPAPIDSNALAVATPDAGGGHKKHPRVVLDDIGVPSAPSEVSVHFTIPKGTAVNDEAPFRIRWKSSEALENAPDDVASKGADHEHGFRIALRPAHGAKVARLLGEVELVVCDSDSHSICIPVKREVDLTFVVGGGAAPKPIELPLPSANG